MSTSTTTLTEPNPLSRQIPPASSFRTYHPSQQSSIAKVYKEASQLFVTRRIQEALDTIEPLIRRPEPSSHGSDGEVYDSAEPRSHEQRTAPIASASRGARVKVWSLYISIINEVIEIGVEAGKQLFGIVQWKRCISLARDGGLWSEVVDTGYAGVEGDVDAEVVANLATLLLAHAPSQKLTQQRLETYLSASSTPALDVSGHLERNRETHRLHSNGTSTPRDLNSKLKILEIYTLHVLPRNSEWEYAREFISMSEVLDEDRKEAFLQALQNIQDERDFDSKREQELKRQREQQLDDARQRDEVVRKAQHAQSAQEQPQTRRQRQSDPTTEDDYGVDRTRIGSRSRHTAKQANSAPKPHDLSNISRTSATRPGREREPPSRRAQPSTPSLIGRFAFVIQAIQYGVVSMGQNVRSHPMSLFRVLAFVIALLMALSRRDIRDRLIRTRDASWDKLRRTVGMGVKVSYI